MKYAYLAGLLLAFFASLALRAEGELKVLSVQSKGRRVAIESALRSAPVEGFGLQVIDAQGERETLKITDKALNLWILVDSSALCRSFKVDHYLNELLKAAPKYLSEDSLVSVMSYSQNSKVILAKGLSPDKLGGLKIDCQEGTLSSSYDEPLQQMLALSEKTNLETQAWIFSSGNIVLGSGTLKSLQERRVTLRLGIYVPLVLPELQPLLKLNYRDLGELFSYSVVDTDPKKLLVPERRFASEFSPSIDTRGEESLFRIEARSSDEALVASSSFQASVSPSFLGRYLMLFKILLGLTLIGLVYFLVQAYRAKKCPECQRTLSFNEELCLFCHDLRHPSILVGDQQLALPRSSHTLYQGRYGLTLRGRKKNALIRIERREHQDRESFALVPIGSKLAQSISISINDKELRGPRFLASGDRVQIDGTTLSFLGPDEKGKQR